MKKALLKLALGIVSITAGFSSFAQVYTFTNCGVTGRFGPTQAQVNTAYTATSLNGAVTINTQGIQEWTVPATGTYSIETLGAQGGNGSGTSTGGLGARMIGEFTLTAGTVLKILVGQQGGGAPGVNSAGGGGGSFVIQPPYNNNASILVIAGGGGGEAQNSIGTPDGQITNNGLVGGNGGGTAGTAGNGGGSVRFAMGGSGFLGNSADILHNPAWSDFAYSFVNGGVGAEGYTAGYAATASLGGFGGGGASCGCSTGGGGGGGGYSGGGGGGPQDWGAYAFGGGGGSFNNGTNQSNTASNNPGNGQVIITSLCNPTVAPTIVCPINMTVNNDAGVCGAVVSYAAALGNDDCGNFTATLTSGLASGATFPVGTTIGTFNATNAFGTVSCSFTVTVIDAEAPTISCPANITVSNDAGTCDAVVTYTTPVGADNCSGVTVALTSGLASGATFPLGVSTVTYIATDAASNTSTPCSFTVTVIDAEAPTITCPNNVSSCDTVVNGIAPVATSDNCVGEYVTYTLSGATTGSGTTDASGAIFNIGITTVWYHVTDSAGNNDSCSFNVVVHPLPSILMNPFNTDTVCLGDNPMTLPAVNPTGGTYSGPGVVGSTFDPATAGVGTHYVIYSYTDGNSCTNTDSSMIVVRSCVGINESASLNGVSIYPNPTNGLVHINLGNHNGSINYTLSTIEGRIVSQEQSVTANKMTINLNNESKGIYLLRIEDATSSKVYKIIRK